MPTAPIVAKRPWPWPRSLPWGRESPDVDKGTLATVGRGFGVVNIGLLRFTGTLAWFVWLFVHLLFLIGLPNRVIVFLQYIWTYLTYQKDERIIIPEGVLPPVQ